MKKPKQAFSAMDTGVFFILLYIVTFAFALLTYYYIITINNFNGSQCALIVSSDFTVLGVINDMIEAGPIGLKIFYEHIITNSTLVWIIVAIMFIIYYSREQTTKALKVIFNILSFLLISIQHYANMLRERMNKEQKAFEDKMAKQRGEIQLLQKRLNFLKQD